VLSAETSMLQTFSEKRSHPDGIKCIKLLSRCFGCWK